MPRYIVPLVTLFALGCGSSGSSGSPGGSAGADAAGLCVPGDTRSCVGPGDCKGGQSCDNDHTWSVCNCGAGTGGTAGSGGSAGGSAAGAPDGGGTGGVDAAPDGTSSAGSSSGGAAGIDASSAGAAGNLDAGIDGTSTDATADGPAETSDCGVTQETCNGLDDNCDGQVDEGDPGGGAACWVPGKTGVCAMGVNHCVNGSVQCVQENQPTAEACNGLDDDCNGKVDEGDPGGGTPCDVSGQVGVCKAGTTHCVNAVLTCVQNKQASYEACNGLDDDCNGLVDDNWAGQGVSCPVPGLSGVCAVGTYQCDNGVLSCIQLNQPGTEVCDGLDNDCNGKIDDGIPSAPCDDGMTGACAGVTACQSGQMVCVQGGQPSSEVCDGVDNDCNGQVDDNVPSKPCNNGKMGACAGVTACQNAQVVCVDGGQPSPEVCNSKDDNCNGLVDEGLNGVTCSTGQPGICATGTTLCSGGILSCVPYYTPAPELCDGKDNNCNGSTDEDNPLTMCLRSCPSGTSALPHVLSTTCAAGMCGITCASGYYNKDGNYCNGCESATP